MHTHAEKLYYSLIHLNKQEFYLNAFSEEVDSGRILVIIKGLNAENVNV